jgi:uncharacterized membrane protein YesL
MDIFRYDSDLMQAISRVADLAWLNILCFICSIPLITIGSAMTAKYYVAMKLERGEALGVTRTFFRNFKDNFRQNIVVSIILVLIYAFFALDWYLIIKSNASGMITIFTGMLAIFSLMFMVITFCIFPMIARFQMRTFDAFRNALVFGVVHLPRVALGVFLAIIPFVISIWYYKWAWLIWLFIATMALYYNSKFFVKCFDKLEEKTFGPKEPVEEDPDYVLGDGYEEDMAATEKADTEISETDTEENDSEAEADAVDAEEESEEPEKDLEKDSADLEEESEEESE